MTDLPAIGLTRLTLLGAVLCGAGIPGAATGDDARIVETRYDPGRIVCIEGRIRIQATVEFAPDEHIENVAIGDSAGWQVTTNKRANLVFLKPLTANAATNMTVVTDRRTYLFDLVASSAAKPMYILRFTYDEQPAIAHLPDPSAVPQAKVVDTEQTNPYAILDPAQLNFAWRAKGRKELLPSQIYDDGKATFLSWSQDRPLPAILVKNDEGNEGAVNFAARGNLIVIDGVPEEIVLRSGSNSASLINERAPHNPSDDGQPFDIGTITRKGKL